MTITESEYTSITDVCLRGTLFVSKVINGINSVCDRLDIDRLDKQLPYSNEYRIFEVCERKLKEIMFEIGSEYPSDEAIVGQLPFSSFPRLPTFRDVGIGTETNIQASGVVGFALGLVGFGISSAVKAHKKAEQKKKNRITNFVLIYNALVRNI